MNRILLACWFAATLPFIGCDSTENSQTVEQPNDNPAPVESKADMTTPDVYSKDAEDEYPRLTWKRTHGSSESNVTGTITATSFDEVGDQVSQLDWSSEASDLPSIFVELDSINSLRVEVEDSTESEQRQIIATWKRAGETRGSTTAVLMKRSKPLKDVEQVVALLRAHFAGDDLGSLAGWMMP